ncbi:hypothetical protein ACWDV4_22735 [Micromonospora sp. NPDC003197]
MTEQAWRYRYVGPADVLAAALPAGEGRLIRCPSEFNDWAGSVGIRDLAEPFTFVIDGDGVLRLAPRRSEHVACAGGRDVLSAGEITFVAQPGGWAVSEVTNQSTGYCPDIQSWPAVAAALDRAGLRRRPRAFTAAFIFRRCPRCQENNVVKEDDFVCTFCDSDLPRQWNVDPARGHADPGAAR